MVGLSCDGTTTLWLTMEHLVWCRPRPRSLGGARDWSGAPLDHLARRRQLRREATAAEQRLWSRLRRGRLGAKFRRQHPFGPYLVDFYSRAAHLVVEVDGDSHFIPEAGEYDAQRTRFLEDLGLAVLRFTNHDVWTDLDAVEESIWQTCRQRMAGHDRAQWVAAHMIEPGDTVFVGAHRVPTAVAGVGREISAETVYDLQVPGARSFVTDLCCLHDSTPKP